MATKDCIACQARRQETGRRGTNCTECARLASRKYREEHREEYNAYMREYQNKLYARLRAEVFVLLGNKCSHCGYSDLRALDIDHINGGGSKDRKGSRSASYLRKILKEIERYQILCKNCNWIAHLNSLSKPAEA